MIANSSLRDKSRSVKRVKIDNKKLQNGCVFLPLRPLFAPAGCGGYGPGHITAHLVVNKVTGSRDSDTIEGTLESLEDDDNCLQRAGRDGRRDGGT